jgi:predicted RNase H-like nuclease (RuvC/YqgF family)
MHGRNRAVLLIGVAVLVLGTSGVVVAAVDEQASSPGLGLPQVWGARSVEAQDRIGAPLRFGAILLAQAPNQKNETTPSEMAANAPPKGEMSPTQKRSKELRDKIERILNPEVALQEIAEREKEIKRQRRALEAAEKRAPTGFSATDEVIQAQKGLQKLEKEQAEAKAEVETHRAPPEAAPAFAPEVSGPSAFEEEMEAQKERAFQNYESEKASGTLRELLESVR